MIKVLICVDSVTKLARLEALVRSAPSLQLVGSSLGRAGLVQQLAEVRPDVLLEWSEEDPTEGPLPHEMDTRGVRRIVLIGEYPVPVVLSTIRTLGLDLRAILPSWADDREIVAAINAAVAGLVVCHPDLIGHEATGTEGSAKTRGASPAQLTPRESEVLNLLAAGLGNKEIAWQLGISDHTVKFHVASIFDKLDVATRAEAVAVGIRRGLITL